MEVGLQGVQSSQAHGLLDLQGAAFQEPEVQMNEGGVRVSVPYHPVLHLPPPTLAVPHPDPRRCLEEMVKAQEIDGKAVVYPHRRTNEIIGVPSWSAEDERAYLGSGGG